MTFETAMEFVGRIEGGYTNDPNDPGNWTGGKRGVGELKGTKFGISAAAYPDEDIRGLTHERALALFKRDYWELAKCPFLHDRVALVHMDCAVNHGVGRAARLLQEAAQVNVPDLVIDGKVGPQTIAAVALNPDEVRDEYLWLRARFYARLVRDQPWRAPQLPGWILRLVQLRKA